MALIEAVCVVHEVRPDEYGSQDETAIDKRPLLGRCSVGELGLEGDQQLDGKHHGGPEKAVYAYAGEDASWWSSELEREVEPGQFGENLRTTGLDVTGAIIGERWRIGSDDDGVLLEVTQPRIPCATFRGWMGEEGWVKRFTERGTPGAYLRVVKPGSVGAGDRIAVESRPAHGVSIGDCFGGIDAKHAQLLLDADAAGELVLAQSLRRYCDGTIRRE